MHGIDLFSELSIMIVLVTIVSLIMKQLKQPLILGYILTGVLVGTILPLIPGVPLQLKASNFDIFSNLGIALLLFIIGLGLRISVFRKLGMVVFTTALTTLTLLVGIGFGVVQAFGFSPIEALLTGLALFFSSTIIIVKILSDKKEQSRLHGQIAIGVILLDDLVATLALLFVAAGGKGFDVETLGLLFIKGIVLLGTLAFITLKVMNRFIKPFASSQELLFLFTIAWGFGVATTFQMVGFSIEVGALFAGIALAPLPYTQEMTSRLKPLRDFFIVIFFVTLGAGLNVSSLGSVIVPGLILSAIVIVLKPIIVMTVLHLFNYTRRTSFKAAINLSQISEFSIILIALAASNGLVGKELTAIVTIVALITISTSTYLMAFDNQIFSWLERHIKFFDEHEVENDHEANEKHVLILFGYRRGGHEFVRTFERMKKKFVVVDYDPVVIDTLERQQLPHMYGDATDVEFLREVGVKHAKLIVSMMTDFTVNQDLLRYIHRVNPTAVVVCHADDHDEAAELYRLGAAYILLPHYIGSEQINHFIRRNGTSRKAFNQYRQKHLYDLGRAALND